MKLPVMDLDQFAAMVDPRTEAEHIAAFKGLVEEAKAAEARDEHLSAYRLFEKARDELLTVPGTRKLTNDITAKLNQLWTLHQAGKST